MPSSASLASFRLPPASGMSRQSRPLELLCAALLVLGGSLNLLGWVLQTPWLLLTTGGTAMVASVGAAALLAGVALFFSALASPFGPRLTRVTGWILSALGVLGLLQQWGALPQLDLTALHGWFDDNNPYPGRMSAANALALLAQGALLQLLQRAPRRWQGWLAQGLSILLLVLGMAGLVAPLAPLEPLLTPRPVPFSSVTGGALTLLCATGLWLDWYRSYWSSEARVFNEGEKITGIAASMLLIFALGAGVVGVASEARALLAGLDYPGSDPALAWRLLEPVRSQMLWALPMAALFSLSGVLLLRSQIRPLMLEILASREAAREREAVLRAAFNSIGDAVITTDAHARVNYLNPRAQSMTGWSQAQALGKPLSEVFQLVAAGNKLPLQLQLPDSADQGESLLPEDALLLQKGSGERLAIEAGAAPIRGEGGRTHGNILLFRDVGRAQQMAAEMSYLAGHDALTGLANRREFQRRLQQALAQGGKDGRQHALLFMDLDRFKLVNDNAGHQAGDELLRELSRILSARLRRSDLLARMGGDEFAVLLDSCGQEAALRIAEALRATVEEYRFVWDGHTYSLGASLGVLVFGAGQDQAPAELLRMADAACYEAKESGRNRVALYHAAPESSARGAWATRLNTALSQGRFTLLRQRIQGAGGDPGAPFYEVLLGLRDENGVDVAPGVFIPAAERSGLMPTLDRWVIARVIELLHKGEPGVCAVNLCAASIRDPQLLEFLQQALRERPVPPGSLCFGLSETAVTASMTSAMGLIESLQGMGCRVLLDDYGRGLASFFWLKRLPVDYLKVGADLLREVGSDQVDTAVLRAILAVGHALGVKVIAGSVQDEGRRRACLAAGVDLVQGEGVHAPEPLALPAGLQNAFPNALAREPAEPAAAHGSVAA